MSEKPPNLFRRLQRRIRPEKGHQNPSNASATSTPTTQSRDTSPSRAEAFPVTGPQTDPVCVGKSPDLSQAEESTPEIIPSNAPERLWDEAYDAIRHDDAKLVEGYERILSQHLHGQGSISDSEISQPNAIAANSPDARRQQMNELIRVGLEKTAREAKVKDGVNTAMEIVLSLKDMVSSAIAAVPQASLAWSGVCVALGVSKFTIELHITHTDI